MDNIPQKEIEVIKKESHGLIEQAQNYEIKSGQDVDEASLFLKQINDSLKRIEDKRLEFTKPLNQSLRAINETFKLLKAPLESSKSLLSSKILQWRQAEQKRIAAEEERRRKIQEAHKKKGHQVSEPIELERPEKKIGNAQTRMVWKWRVIDKNKVPEQFKEINQVAVNAAIRSGTTKIDGLEIYQEEVLAIVGR